MYSGAEYVDRSYLYEIGTFEVRSAPAAYLSDLAKRILSQILAIRSKSHLETTPEFFSGT